MLTNVSFAFNEALIQHNLTRINENTVENIEPPLGLFTWSDSLEKSAQAHTEKCIWEHSKSRSYGENLYIGSSRYETYENAVTLWYKEKANYNNGVCTGVCGHYTQLVWANSKFLGCGKTYCPSVEGISWGGGTVIACQYSPPGNWVGQQPYTHGEYKYTDTLTGNVLDIKGFELDNSFYDISFVYQEPNLILTDIMEVDKKGSYSQFTTDDYLYLPSVEDSWWFLLKYTGEDLKFAPKYYGTK